MTKLRHKEIMSLAQGHTVRKGQSQNSNPGIVTLGPAWVDFSLPLSLFFLFAKTLN